MNIFSYYFYSNHLEMAEPQKKLETKLQKEHYLGRRKPGRCLEKSFRSEKKTQRCRFGEVRSEKKTPNWRSQIFVVVLEKFGEVSSEKKTKASFWRSQMGVGILGICFRCVGMELFPLNF